MATSPPTVDSAGELACVYTVETTAINAVRDRLPL